MDLTLEPPPEPKPERRYYYEETDTASPPPPPRSIEVNSTTWKILLGLAGGLALLIWSTWLEPVELPPIVVQLYSEPGPGPLSPRPVKEKQPPPLPENWRQRFEPKPKKYPGADWETRTQSEYRKVKRYEFLPEVLESQPTKSLTVESNRPVPRTTHVRDKSLVLAGRGFEIGRFEPDKGLTFRLNTLPVPEPNMVPLDSLPEYGNNRDGLQTVRHGKGVVFHAGATGVPPEISLEIAPKEAETVSPEPEEPVVDAGTVPEMRVLLDVAGEALLKLDSSKAAPLDLLNEHPAILRHEFEKREKQGD
ncbi:hypothetical protein [Nitrospina gracilis]|uniref:hypothetical protein n=1 Tax=Nitrospina gracilis TaxID=35801 RepID=UPI001F393E1B|nr:hypothetical protein [Nitrospina gracilis]MCF8720122.1 hypothetical protein [Nitrospina gracilis Nb-211]